MSDSPITLEFIGRQLLAMQAEQRQIRSDLTTMMTLVVSQSEWNRKFEQRMVQFDQRLVDFEQRLVDQTDILVAEFKGRIGISQSMVERRMDDLSERVEELETGKSRFIP